MNKLDIESMGGRGTRSYKQVKEFIDSVEIKYKIELLKSNSEDKCRIGCDDVEWVKEFCKRWNIPLDKVEIIQINKHDSLEGSSFDWIEIDGLQ